MARVGSMFAGIGGTCLGFMQAGAEIVWANEIDSNACITYKNYFGDSYLQEGDISQIDKRTIPALDILIGGFPCQAFSVAGYRKGFEDDRGNVFFQIIEVLEAQLEVYGRLPQAIMLENVKNLYTHDQGNTYRVIGEALNDLGYTIKSDILNSMEYGNVPQNRERIYIVGFLDPAQTERFRFPERIPLTNLLNDVVDRVNPVDDKLYYNQTSQYYDMLKEGILESESRYETTYQLRRVYVRENRSNVCPTLTANMGTGGHNVPLITDYNDRIRKLTPEECIRLQGFPQDFSFPESMANSHRYKQSGNSVTVPVIRRIAQNILQVFEDQEIPQDHTEVFFQHNA
ncbi:DNA cytosine methyltransferase [Metabacillus sp. 84]|uniref:DNA cytosine methyltransferase n=1 Tax=Metabacillus sp. 84 TaxID=3404705 RepID=UPI003CEEE0F3